MKFKTRVIVSVLCFTTVLPSLIVILDMFKVYSSDTTIPKTRDHSKTGETVHHLDIITGNNSDKIARTNGTNVVVQKVGKRFLLCRRIGSGTFERINLGIDMANGENVAVKIDRFVNINSTVRKEGNIYRALEGEKGFPTARWSGREGGYNILVMELLGLNLQKYFELCDYRFSLKTTLLLADQMISRLQYLHLKGFLHRDVSPSNFVVGLGDKKHIIYNIDFSFAMRYIDRNSGKHVSNRYVGFTGTERYSSLRAHEGYQQSRRDDMESLGYVFVYFLKGKLPWQGMKSKIESRQRDKKLEVKRSITVAELCKGLPVEFSEYLNICRSLKFEEKPDYARLRNLFKNAFREQNFTYNHMFDWNNVSGICKTSPENEDNDRCLPVTLPSR